MSFVLIRFCLKWRKMSLCYRAFGKDSPRLIQPHCAIYICLLLFQLTLWYVLCFMIWVLCFYSLQWNPSCEATPFASEKWPFKRGGLSSGVENNTFMFRFTLSSGLSRQGWPLIRGSTVYTLMLYFCSLSASEGGYKSLSVMLTSCWWTLFAPYCVFSAIDLLICCV